MVNYLFELLATKHPQLPRHLELARIDEEPEDFIRKTVTVAAIITFVFALLVAPFLLIFQASLLYLIPVIILGYVFFYFAFINLPEQSYRKAEKMIDQEITSAVRFLILETKIEPSLYYAIANTSRNFPVVGIYLDEVLKEVEVGSTLERALFKASETVPSSNLQNIFWQMTNSIQTGADVTSSLKRQLNEIIEGQKIAINNYGKELSALTLFYMFTSIIIPTVGFAIVLAVMSVAGIVISIWELISLWALIAVLQYTFLQMVLSKRPSVEAH